MSSETADAGGDIKVMGRDRFSMKDEIPDSIVTRGVGSRARDSAEVQPRTLAFTPDENGGECRSSVRFLE